MKGRLDGDIWTALVSIALGVIIAVAWVYHFYFRRDPSGTVVVFCLFAVFLPALGLCVSKRATLSRFLPETWGRVFFGLLSAFTLYLAGAQEGRMADVLIITAILLAVVAIVYPIFTIFGPDPPLKKKKPSPPAAHEKAAKEKAAQGSPYPKRKARKRGYRKHR